MRAITRSCVLLLWMHALTLVKSQDCKLKDFIGSDLYDSNFDTTSLEETYDHGRQVRVSCTVGHSGFFKLICSQGTWSSRGKPCQPRSCGHPGDAQFAEFLLVQGEDFVFGSKVVYTCHKGYQMVSRTNFRRCMAEGWDGVIPICEAQQCPVAYMDSNVLVNGDPEEATYGNVIRFSCKSNLEILDGPAEIYCDENGEWSGKVPKCKEIKCPAPVIENGYVQGTTEEYKNGEVLHYRCYERYTKAEERQPKCTKIGERADWSPTPLCEPTKCRLKPALYGTTYDPPFKNVFLPDEKLTVHCREDFWISDPLLRSVEATCNDDGQWSIRPVCKEVVCRSERERNVISWGVWWNEVLKMGREIRYTCQEGYKSTDDSYLAKCTREGWKPDPLCQAISCDRVDIPNALNNQQWKEKYQYNERATYTCMEGFKGAPTRICKENGWRGESKCTEITCTRQDVENADIDGIVKHEYAYKEKVKYVCKRGYEGSFTLTCGINRWYGSEQCSRIKCKKPDLVNAIITNNEKEAYNTNEQIWYKCTYSRAVHVATCQQGDWTGIMDCSGKKCKKPDLVNAIITNNEKEAYDTNEQIWYMCTYSRAVHAATCQQGNWTGIMDCSDCQKAEVPNGFTVEKKDGKLYHTCNQGYKLFAKGWWAEATCTNHSWSGLYECIAITNCGQIPAIPNAEMRNIHKVYKPDEHVQILCKEGFQAQVNNLTCQEGTWISYGLPLEEICTPLASNCKPPPQFDNAVVVNSYQKEFLANSEVSYACRHKYTVGENTLRCKGGEWEDKKIICAPQEH